MLRCFTVLILRNSYPNLFQNKRVIIYMLVSKAIQRYTVLIDLVVFETWLCVMVACLMKTVKKMYKFE